MLKNMWEMKVMIINEMGCIEYPRNVRNDLLYSFDGSPQRPIKINQDFGIWSLQGIKDANIYVQKGREFDLQFWYKCRENNVAIIFVDLKNIVRRGNKR